MDFAILPTVSRLILALETTVVLRTAGAISPARILMEAPMDLAIHPLVTSHQEALETLVVVVEEDAAVAANEILTNASKGRSAQARRAF